MRRCGAVEKRAFLQRAFVVTANFSVNSGCINEMCVIMAHSGILHNAEKLLMETHVNLYRS